MGEARFEELDLQLANTQERHAELDEAVIAAERRLADAREQLRTLERQAQESAVPGAFARSRARGELQRAIDTAAQQVAANEQAAAQLAGEMETLNDAAAQAGLQERAGAALEREAALAAQRSDYDDLSRAAASAPTNSASRSSTAWSRCARRSPSCSSRSRRRSSAARNTWSSSARRRSISTRSPRASRPAASSSQGLQGEIDRISREVAALGAVNLAALDELTTARERKTVPRRAERRSHRCHHHAGRRDPQDRPRNARPARADLQPGQRAFRPHVPDPVRRRQREARDDGRRDPRRRRAGDGAAAGQEEQHHPPAVGRREGADRDRAGVRHLPAQSRRRSACSTRSTRRWTTPTPSATASS